MCIRENLSNGSLDYSFKIKRREKEAEFDFLNFSKLVGIL